MLKLHLSASVVKSLIIHEENTKEIMSVKGTVYTLIYRFLSIFMLNFNFDFLFLYEMYFQNDFTNRSIKLASFTSHLQHSRPCCIRCTTLAFDSSLYIRYNTSAYDVNSTCSSQPQLEIIQNSCSRAHVITVYVNKAYTNNNIPQFHEFA